MKRVSAKHPKKGHKELQGPFYSLRRETMLLSSARVDAMKQRRMPYLGTGTSMEELGMPQIYQCSCLDSEYTVDKHMMYIYLVLPMCFLFLSGQDFFGMTINFCHNRQFLSDQLFLAFYYVSHPIASFQPICSLQWQFV